MSYDIFRSFGIVRFYAQQLLGANPTWYFVIFAVCILACMIISYFLGGLNFAIILSKKTYGVDIRDFGSGNAGMTNMRRTFGKKAGLITFAGDTGKTFVACLLGYILVGRLGAYIAGFFCMIGHMFPIKYKFKGGKGVACAAVLVLMTDLGSPVYYVPVVFLILLACFAVIVLGTKYLSLGSMMSVALFPLFRSSFEMSWLTKESAYFASQLEQQGEIIETARYTVFNLYLIDNAFFAVISVLTAVMVVFMHRANIKRLLNHEESKFFLGKKTQKPIFDENDKSNKNG